MTDSGRAVSEVLGFVLVASLIFATLGVVYVGGLGGLEDARDAERVKNAERAFGVLANNIEDLQTEGAPSRATEIKLADAQIGFGEPTTVTVNVTNTGAAENPVFSTDIDPIVYSAGTGSKLVYENGALFRVDHDSAVLKQRPPGVFWAEGSVSKTTVPYVQTRQGGSTGVGGDTTVLVRTDLVSTEVPGSLTSPGADGVTDDPDGDGNLEYAVNYTVRTTPTRAVVWTKHLNARIEASGNETAFDNHDIDGDGDVTDDPACSQSGGTVVCKLMVERIHVSASRVDVTFG